MQIYMGKSFKNVDFVTKWEVFESKEVVDWENYRDYKSIILIIIVTKKVKKNTELLDTTVSLPKQFISLLEYKHSDNLIICSAQ